MHELIVDTKIDALKPSMKVLRDIEDVPLPSVLQTKADGELQYFNFSREGFSFTEAQGYVLNKWGKLRTGFRAVNDLILALRNSHFSQAEIMCELYGIKPDGRPMILPEFLHAIKGTPPQLDLIHLGIFNLLTLNGSPCNESPIYKWQTLEPFLKDYTHARILPYMKATTKSDVYGFWKYHVHDGKFEGLVIRTALDTFKLKPHGELDAVIIGINKKSGYGRGNLFAQQLVTTVKLALMTPEGNYVEIGDCASGIDRQLRRSLWKLMDYRVGEDDKTVYVKPLVIVNVEYTDLFVGKNTVYSLTADGFQTRGTMRLIRFRHPRLIRFRPDKTVNPTDLAIQQIPQAYLEEST